MNSLTPQAVTDTFHRKNAKLHEWNISQIDQKIKNKEKRKKRRKNEYYEINFISKDENFNGKKIFKKRSSEIESEQKNQSDQNIQ